MNKFQPLTHYANEYGIPIATLLDHCEAGELRAIKVGVGKSRNHYRLPQEWWDEFLKQQEQAAKKPTEKFLPPSDDEIELLRLRVARLRENPGASSRPRSRRRVSP